MIKKEKKTFNRSKPHQHICDVCYDLIYCCGKDCDIPKYATCIDCIAVTYRINNVDLDFKEDDIYEE